MKKINLSTSTGQSTPISSQIEMLDDKEVSEELQNYGAANVGPTRTTRIVYAYVYERKLPKLMAVSRGVGRGSSTFREREGGGNVTTTMW